jgi:hypothetical protein
MFLKRYYSFFVILLLVQMISINCEYFTSIDHLNILIDSSERVINVIDKMNIIDNETTIGR